MNPNVFTVTDKMVAAMPAIEIGSLITEAMTQSNAWERRASQLQKNPEPDQRKRSEQLASGAPHWLPYALRLAKAADGRLDRVLGDEMQMYLRLSDMDSD